ncbi:hypothetical protein LTR36_007479, partial [Oleoguttula mirabilis]
MKFLAILMLVAGLASSALAANLAPPSGGPATPSTTAAPTVLPRSWQKPDWRTIYTAEQLPSTFVTIPREDWASDAIDNANINYAQNNQFYGNGKRAEATPNAS